MPNRTGSDWLIIARDYFWNNVRRLLFKGFARVVLIIFVFCYGIYFLKKVEKDALINQTLGSGDVEDLVQPEKDTLILNGLISGNRSKVPGKNPFILIGVTSSPGNVFRRDIIRSTWAYKAYENYGATVVFFIGRSSSYQEMAALSREAEQHNDLIVDDFQESYYALSIKTLRLLKYFKIHYTKARFLIKTDDDVFVNVRNLVDYCFTQDRGFELRRGHLESEGDEQTGNGDQSYPEPFLFIGGVIHYNRGPHTWNPFSKWYAPASVWRHVYEHVVSPRKFTINNGESEGTAKLHENMYPSYAEGNFYVLSSDAVVEILEVSRSVPLYHLEDVFVTGVLATWMLGIQKEKIPFVSSASNVYPAWSYWWYTRFTPPGYIIAFHCDTQVELVGKIYQDSNKDAT